MKTEIRTALRPPRAGAAARWGWPHYLAALAIPLGLWEAWTVVAWLADGPYQITEFRDRDSAAWYAAHVIEAAVVVVAVVMAVHVIRGVRRAGRLTFEAMFCLGGLSMVWGSENPNFFAPEFLISSNWVNVNNPCGHMPFVVNPDCGRVPDAILFNVTLDTFVLLALAIGGARAVGWVRRRWPDLSTVQLLLVVFGGACVLDVVFEAGVMIPLHLWTWAPSAVSAPLGGGFRYPVFEILGAGLGLGIPVALYTFRDDKGRTLVERRLDHHSPRVRTAITMAAVYTCFQITIWVSGIATWPLAFFETRWEPLPAHIVNDVCDAPGFTGTRYGPCPGSPGFRMPGRHSLPGQSP